MAKNYYDITLALAGICQSARLVQQLAHQGHCDGDALHVSLNSIIDMNPSSTLAVFGGSEANLRVGLETLLGVLNASSRQGLNAELTRYTLSLMVLERKLSSAKGALDTLGNRINGLQRQLEHFDLQSETLMSAMAAIYVDVISPLGPRIQVTGSPAVLQSPQVQGPAAGHRARSAFPSPADAQCCRCGHHEGDCASDAGTAGGGIQPD